LFARLFRSSVRTEKVSHASALSVQFRFGSDCSFARSFGKSEPAWQKISEAWRGYGFGGKTFATSAPALTDEVR
jgi:hypothetical protein